MKLASFLMLVLTSLLIQGCQTNGSAYPEWTLEEKITRFSNQTHHWGQKGQVELHNGWSNYGYLKIDMGGDDYLVFMQDEKELSAEVYSQSTNSSILRVLSIPGAGIFYSPKGEYACSPDTIEGLGLYAEIALLYASKAYPNGPEEIPSALFAEVSGSSEELRFMQGVKRMPKRWSLVATIEPIGPMHFIISIEEKGIGELMSIEWRDDGSEMVSSDENLSGWLPCWSGIRSTDKDGNVSFTTNLSGTDEMESFGQIRDVLNKKP